MNSVPRPRPEWFVPFDECRAVRIYQRNLLHCVRTAARTFVTFRLADTRSPTT